MLSRHWRAVVAAMVMLACVAAVAVGCIPGKPQPQEDIKIVVVGPMTGSSAEWGQSMREGVEIAVDEINTAGGILGRKLTFRVEDDKGDPKEAVAVAQKVVAEPDVTAVIGPFFTSCTMAAGPVYQRAGIPEIAIASTHPDVPKIGDYVFRPNPTNTHQGSGVVAFCVEELGKKKLAVLYPEDDYGRGIFEVVRATAGKLGAEIVYSASHPTKGELDFTAILTAAKAKKPDVLVLFSFYTQAGQIVRQAKLVGLNVPVVGGDPLYQPGFVQIGGANAEGTYVASWFHPQGKDPVTREYVEKYEKRYNKPADTWSPFAYDAVKILAEAIQRAGKTERRAVRDEIARTSGFRGATGIITFDAEGAPDVSVKTLLFVQVRDGKFVLLE